MVYEVDAEDIPGVTRVDVSVFKTLEDAIKDDARDESMRDDMTFEDSETTFDDNGVADDISVCELLVKLDM